MTLQRAASNPYLPRAGDSRVCLSGNALPPVTCRQGCRSACSHAKGERLDDVVQELVKEAPFPGTLAGQGRHNFARLVMQRLLQVRVKCAGLHPHHIGGLPPRFQALGQPGCLESFPAAMRYA